MLRLLCAMKGDGLLSKEESAETLLLSTDLSVLSRSKHALKAELSLMKGILAKSFSLVSISYYRSVLYF